MKHIFETAIAIGCTIVIVSVGIAAATHRISISRAESIIEKTAGVRRNPAQLIEAAGKTGSVVKRAIEKPSQGKSTAERIKSVTKELGDELLNSSSSEATMPLIPASTSPSLLYKQKPLIFGHRNLNLSLGNGQNSREVLEPTLSQMVSQDQAADALERLSVSMPLQARKSREKWAKGLVVTTTTTSVFIAQPSR